MVIIENFHSDLKCLSYLPRSCFGFLVADDVGGWLVIGTMRKFRSANGINRSSLAWDSVGRDTESGNRSTLNSFTLMFQKLRLSSHGKKHWSYSSSHAFQNIVKPCWLVDFFPGSMLAPPTLKVLRCDDVVPRQHVIMPVWQRPDRPFIVHALVRSIHLLPRFQVCLRAQGQRAKGGQGPINGKQQLEHNRDRMAPMSSKVRFFVKEKLRGIGDMLFWPAWLLLFGMKMTIVKRYEDLEALGGQIIEGDECAAMVFV